VPPDPSGPLYQPLDLRWVVSGPDHSPADGTDHPGDLHEQPSARSGRDDRAQPRKPFVA
jgi:hypothetical protein